MASTAGPMAGSSERPVNIDVAAHYDLDLLEQRLSMTAAVAPSQVRAFQPNLVPHGDACTGEPVSLEGSDSIEPVIDVENLQPSANLAVGSNSATAATLRAVSSPVSSMPKLSIPGVPPSIPMLPSGIAAGGGGGGASSARRSASSAMSARCGARGGVPASSRLHSATASSAKRLPLRGASAATTSASVVPSARRTSMSARTASSATGRKVGVDPLLAHGYTTISPIANGAFSQVLRARHVGTKQEVAVKTFSRELLSKESNAHLFAAMRHELGVLSSLRDGQHPCVANLVAVHEGPTQIVACLEYCGGGSLHKALQRAGACDRPHAFGLGEPVSVRVSLQLASALAFLHGRGVAHRDIKPQNVLFSEPPPNITPGSARSEAAIGSNACAIKLCDFGFAVQSGGKPVRTICGTPQYMAPELATAAMSSRKGYGAFEVDLWAFGAMVFELLEGRPAFSGVGLAQLNERIRRANTNDFTTKTPAAAKALVKSLLRVEPTERRAAGDAMKHGWFAQLAN